MNVPGENIWGRSGTPSSGLLGRGEKVAGLIKRGAKKAKAKKENAVID